MNQKTIARKIKCSGIGIHSGKKATLTFKPAEENTGIVFIRGDIGAHARIPALVENVEAVVRGTTIGKDGFTVLTVEHVMAAVAGFGIDNLIIEIDGVEVPAGDGSSSCFVQAIKKAGIKEQKAKKKVAILTEPLSYQENGIYFLVLPHDSLKISFQIQYPNPLVGSQFDSLEINSETFLDKLADARTFAFLEEVEELKKAGLIKGGSLENAVVIGEDKILNKDALRSSKELVRHKIVDLLGDIYLLGRPLKAHIISFKSGHPSNINLVRKLHEHLAIQEGIEPVKAPVKRKASAKGVANNQVIIGIKQVMEKLPHRYPFLLVDRIIEFEAEKRVVGIKNVSINEPFFQGHFPGHPIMPGVLIVEAMGQTGGLLLMNSVLKPENTVMYFMSLDKIKFRRPVFPGDQLRMELQMLRFRHRICKMKGCTYVGDDLVAEAEMTAMVVDKDRLPEQYY
ncbi:MAG TPA: bifunctional UDP-3-O-[3-hydroxymyristoyl] N-acetylglucosamine deacetylase/3-hydroxyacyl-ACP dehydratase [archaeon]|nr:bifunctional UDP-3-O-[3-hydroxymyristoyl] N-acetylglucosamine deacetylase/3-hydroxyacyl-ACP dehydratase [archaeon]